MTTDDPQKIKARLNGIAADVRDVYQDAACCINALQEEMSDMRADRDRAVEDYNYWYKRWEHAIYFGTPRVITAEELKVGQVVALIGKTGVFQIAGKFTGWKQGLGITWFTVKTGRRVDDQVAYKDTDTIVLLADAPDEQQEPERLTVADLHAAPPGSELVRDDREFPAFKQTDGSWLCQPLGKGKGASMEFILAAGWDTATLTHPAPAPVTAETIRQSEPGSTWEDRDGAVLEWDGAWMLYHNDGEGLGAVISAGQAEINYGPLTRSTAAPRGDYGKAEVPSGHSVQIDPAVYETMFSDQKFLARLHDEIRTAKVVTDD